MRPDKLSIPFLTVKECDEIVQSSDQWVEGTVFKFGQLIKQKQCRSVQICNGGISTELEDRIFKTIFYIWIFF